MSDDRSTLPSDDRVRRQVGRRIANTFLLGLSAAVIAAWSFFGYYELEPGESAVILRMGRYSRTVATPGPRFHLPPPLETHEIVNTSALERETFGYTQEQGGAGPSAGAAAEAAMQTSGNNIVHVSFEVQYRVSDPFFARYRIADPRETLRDAAQAAVREVVGQDTIDGVISERRAVLSEKAREILQRTLDSYESGLHVDQLLFRDVQPPPQVRDAFDDVIAAIQDRNRTVNEAQGYANEVIPQARATVSELMASAQAYHDTLKAEAEGDGQRFLSLATEYKRAPEVVWERLYLETMEHVLPRTQTIVIDSQMPVLPYLPLGAAAAPAVAASTEPVAPARPLPPLPSPRPAGAPPASAPAPVAAPAGGAQ